MRTHNMFLWKHKKNISAFRLKESSLSEVKIFSLTDLFPLECNDSP